MKAEVKEFLTTISKLNVILKRNSLMLEELSHDWRDVFKEVNIASQNITKLNKEQRQDFLNKTNRILTLCPTYYNNNADILYETFKKDTATFLNKTSLVKDNSFEQIYLQQQTLDFEYNNYQKHKESFSQTLKSIQVFQNLLNKNDELQK